MVKKWYEVDMNNSKNQSYYGKAMQKDLADLVKNNINNPVPPPSSSQKMIILDNAIILVNLANKNASVDWTNLDLSSLIPSNAKFVYLCVSCRIHGGYTSWMIVRRDAAHGSDAFATAAPLTFNDYHGFVWLDVSASKIIQYKLYVANGSIASGKIRLYGYIEETE